MQSGVGAACGPCRFVKQSKSMARHMKNRRTRIMATMTRSSLARTPIPHPDCRESVASKFDLIVNATELRSSADRLSVAQKRLVNHHPYTWHYHSRCTLLPGHSNSARADEHDSCSRTRYVKLELLCPSPLSQFRWHRETIH